MNFGIALGGFLVGFFLTAVLRTIGQMWDEAHKYEIRYNPSEDKYMLIDNDNWHWHGLSSQKTVFESKEYSEVEDRILYLRERNKGFPKHINK